VLRRTAGWCALVVAAAGAGVGCGGAKSPDTPARSEAAEVASVTPRKLQRALDAAREGMQVPGASAAVQLPGQRLWVGTSGVTDVRTRNRVTPDTLFAIASVTKTLTAALVLTLAEQRVLSLDDRLSRWVPDFPDADRITLRQLLNHTAGTQDLAAVEAFDRAVRRRGPDAVWRPRRTLRFATSPVGEPGEQWSYSTTGYLLLGLVVERATRSSFAAELHRLLPRRSFRRLVFQRPERPTGPVATGYQDLDGDLENEAFRPDPFLPTTAEATIPWAGGSVVSTAGDVARALHGILAGDLLTSDSRRAMTTWIETDFGGNSPDGPPEYGLGLAREDFVGHEAWGHVGDTLGFHAEAWYLPESGATVVALANLQAGPILGSRQDDIVRDLAAVVTGD
jgi:D-alanyl-D-alanine carboxypeptidase